MRIIFPYLLLVSQILGQQSRECEEGYECVPADDCEVFKNNRENLKTLEKDSSEYKVLLRSLKNLVCNKNPRKICCQAQIPSSSPSWIPSNGQCGKSGSDPSFIVGGTDTKLGEFPWMALIGSKNSGGTLEWTCGGALINKWQVVSENIPFNNCCLGMF